MYGCFVLSKGTLVNVSYIKSVVARNIAFNEICVRFRSFLVYRSINVQILMGLEECPKNVSLPEDTPVQLALLALWSLLARVPALDYFRPLTFQR